MLSFYLSTIIIWFIIIFCTIKIFSNKIIERYSEYLIEDHDFVKGAAAILTISAVPVFRVIIEIAIIYMAFCSEDSYHDIIEKLQQK